MSRPIKFRVYIKPLKRYAEKYETILYHHQCNMEPSWTVNISPEEYYGDEDLVIEQFTGLLDRNGKEIYEGDIVQIDDHILGDFEVVWHNLGWKIKRSVGYESLSAHKSEDCTVIGIIHENPELLNKEEEK